MKSHRWHRRGLMLFAAVVMSVPRPSTAQLAPTGGHYGGRPNDTGHHLGGPNEMGGYATSIPLALPPARGGLPVPLQIVHGGRGFGAAGLGWDVPLSYVRVENSFAHRRPARTAGDSPPQPRRQVILALAGGQLDMVPKGTDWVARHGATTITLRSTGATWQAFDGEGLTYTFSQDAPLVGSGLWLLESVNGAAGASLRVRYDIQTPMLAGAVGPALAVFSSGQSLIRSVMSTSCWAFSNCGA